MKNFKKTSRKILTILSVVMLIGVLCVGVAAEGEAGGGGVSGLGIKKVDLKTVLPTIADILGAIVAVSGVINGVVKISEAKMDSNDAAKDAGVRSIIWGVAGGAALAILVNLFI